MSYPFPKPHEKSQAIRDLLFAYLPDFCWQTAYEILLMLEQVDEDVDERSFYLELNKMVKTGYIHIRPNPRNIFGLAPNRIGSAGFPAQYIKSPSWTQRCVVKKHKYPEQTRIAA